MRWVFACAVTAATLLCGACAAGASGGQLQTPAAPPPSPAPSSPVPSLLPGSNSGADPQPAVDAAVSDAAAHLGVSEIALHVDQVEARQWPDSSLGCPKPGLMYSQIVTPGFVVFLSGAGKRLEYHTDARGTVVLCQES
jgi:hypothetical protein